MRFEKKIFAPLGKPSPTFPSTLPLYVLFRRKIAMDLVSCASFLLLREWLTKDAIREMAIVKMVKDNYIQVYIDIGRMNIDKMTGGILQHALKWLDENLEFLLVKEERV